MTTSKSPTLQANSPKGDNHADAHSVAGVKPRVLVFMEAREFGGPAKNLAAGAKLLAGLVEFKVVTFIRGNAAESEFTEKLAEHGVPYEVIRERFRYDPRGMASLRRIVRSYQPNIVQIHNGKSRLYAFMLRRLGLLGQFQTIDCYHGETWTDTKQLAYNKLDRWLFRRAKNIIVVSQRQVRLLAEFGVPGERITVIYNGIRLLPSELRPPNETLKVITVGRLSREKGHADLMQAVQALLARGVAPFKVFVVGDGPEIDALKEAAQRDGIADVVEFTGYQSDPTPYYETADLFVLPSLTEGIPNVLLEAAMHHVPIVSTDVGGIPEMFVDSKEAMLVPPADVDALANAMEHCLQDDAFRAGLATAARAKVENRFSDDQRAQQYLDYYRALISNPA